MPDAESFIAAIAANPADDLPRLVFADWLEENGDPTRAGFIRDHVRLAKVRPNTDEYKTLFRRCADTLKANLPAWIKPACDAFGQPAEWKPGKAVGGRFAIDLDRRTVDGRPLACALGRLEYTRGVVGRIELLPAAITRSQGVDELFRLYPVTQVRLEGMMNVNDWARIETPRLQSLRALELALREDNETWHQVLFSPHLGNVQQLTVVETSAVQRLVRSPMAKRLTELQVPGEFQIIQALHEFPLDDKLQQFTVLGGPNRSPDTKLKIGTGTYLGGYISFVPFRPTLKRLDLSRCRLHDEDMVRFARGEEWVRLQGLKLGGNLFTDTGWSDFCRGWRTPELTYLDVSRNRLTDDGADMLSRSGMLKTLRVIDLRGNRIAGRGAVTLARAVAEGKLNKLLLAGNPIGKREAATVKGLLGGRTDIG